MLWKEPPKNPLNYEEYDFCLGTEKQLAGVAKFDQLSYVCFINIIKEFNVYQTR